MKSGYLLRDVVNRVFLDQKKAEQVSYVARRQVLRL
jgi:hypothetical protein